MDRQTLIARLREIIDPDYVLSSDMDLELYGYDASLERARPDVVVVPGSTEEVSKVTALAHREKIPVIARGSGTNLSGGTIAIKGGIVVHFSRMNRILEIDIPNRTVIVEPGVITLNRVLFTPRIRPVRRFPPWVGTLGRIREAPIALNTGSQPTMSWVLRLFFTMARLFGPAESPRTIPVMT